MQLELTKRSIDFLDKAQLIQAKKAEIKNAYFMYSIFCQLGLPRSKQSSSTFGRECGKMRLVVDSGFHFLPGKVETTELPFGVAARLLLIYICTYAVQHKTPRINFGSSAAQFLNDLGIISTGGARGSLTSFKRQMANLRCCNIECDYFYGTKLLSYCGPIFMETEGSALRGFSWSKELLLNINFYESLVLERNAIPIDGRAVLALKGSALSLDIYFMLCERLHRAPNAEKILYWKSLRSQFGHEYANTENGKRSFKRNFLKALIKVKLVYPDANVEPVKKGIIIKKSNPAIPKNDVKSGCA